MIYAEGEYKRYKRYYITLLNQFSKEKNSFLWFRSYTEIKKDFRILLTEGKQIEKLVNARKVLLAKKSLIHLNQLQIKIKKLKILTSKINEGRLARVNLTRADIVISDAKFAYNNGKFEEVGNLLSTAEEYLNMCIIQLSKVFNRYSSSPQVEKWKRMINETIGESKRKGIIAIVVSKIERKLIVYKNGQLLHMFQIGLGWSDLKDKHHAGDNATPEGRYYVVKKKASSHYYRALLLNYPNEEDKRNFVLARKKGLISKTVGIGGSVEIHGGGIHFMTRGCVSLDNTNMDILFKLSKVSTPVTIVGSFDYPAQILSLLSED